MGRQFELARAAAAAALVGLLTGCSALGTDTPRSWTDTAANLLVFNKSNSPPPATQVKEVVKIDCPEIEVQDGTAAVRTYAGGEGNGNVRYQYSLGDVVRECTVVGNQISIKVGIEGRVLLGPMGAAGNFSPPVRVAVRDDNSRKAVVSKLYSVAVTVPTGSSEAPFTLVTDPMLVPLVNARADEDYTILVGFDTGAPSEAAPHRHKPKG